MRCLVFSKTNFTSKFRKYRANLLPEGSLCVPFDDFRSKFRYFSRFSLIFADLISKFFVSFRVQFFTRVELTALAVFCSENEGAKIFCTELLEPSYTFGPLDGNWPARLLCSNVNWSWGNLGKWRRAFSLGTFRSLVTSSHRNVTNYVFNLKCCSEQF